MSVSNSDLVRPWRILLQTHAAVVDQLSKEMDDEVGLPLGWYEVLLHLEESENGRLRMHEIADSMLLSRSAVTRFVDRMEGAGLVARVSCPSDRRGLEVVMTESGRDLFRKAGRVHLRGIKEHFLAHLSTDDAAALADVLAKVLESVRSAPSGDQSQGDG